MAEAFGPEGQVGHSFFMVPGLDEGRLRAVWEHHVGPHVEGWRGLNPRANVAVEFERWWRGTESSS